MAADFESADVRAKLLTGDGDIWRHFVACAREPLRGAAGAALRRAGRYSAPLLDDCAPLCEFLGLSTPEAAFPHANQREEFWDLVRGNT
ncbi:MAG: sulfotransferase [Pseudomonadota bacterium]